MTSTSTYEVGLSRMWAVGIDEAGRGPVVGPLVVAAVRVPLSDVELLVSNGVTDSKLLSATRRQEIAAWLYDEARERNWGIAVHSSSPWMIDVAMQATNLNDHEVEIFASLARSVTPTNIRAEGGILQLDACDINTRRFGNNVASRIASWPWQDWTITSEHGADLSMPAVGAASIIAKVARDEAINALSVKLGINLGSGYPSDPLTIAAIPELLSGNEPHDALRWRWATVEEAWIKLHGIEPPTRQLQADGTGLGGGQSRLELL